MHDRERQDKQDDTASFPFSSITQDILKCCFEVMNTLGIGFAESVYHNALMIAMTDLGLKVTSEQCFEVRFKNRIIGQFRARPTITSQSETARKPRGSTIVWRSIEFFRNSIFEYAYSI